MKSSGKVSAPAKNTAAQKKLNSILHQFLNATLQYLSELDPAEPDTLRFAVANLLQAHFEPKVLAQLCGVSRTTITRWAAGQNIPRAPGYRSYVMRQLHQHLGDVLAGKTDKDILLPHPEDHPVRPAIGRRRSIKERSPV